MDKSKDKSKLSRSGRVDTEQRPVGPVPIGDLITSVFPESAAVVRRQAKSAPETALPDLYETINTLTVKVGNLTDTMGAVQQYLQLMETLVKRIMDDHGLLDKRIKALEKKAAKRPGEHDRIKVLAGHLRVGDRYRGKTVKWLGKNWNEQFVAVDEDLPPGVVFAPTEISRWANVQYAYLEADPDDD